MIAKSACRYLALFTGTWMLVAMGGADQPAAADETAGAEERTAANERSAGDEIDPAAIKAAFAAAADGFSSDEVLIQDRLRERFFQHLERAGIETDDPETQRDALLTLIKIRKAGKLTQRATRRGPSTDQQTLPIAEIAARVVADRYRITSDTMLADPRYRKDLQQEAELIDPEVDAYQVRKAVLFLRKNRMLKPELVLKVADWERQVRTLTLSQLRSQLAAAQIPPRPGVYLFRDSNRYLYIGEASNLAERLKQHTEASDRPALADHLARDEAAQVTVELHLFPADSPAAKTTVRRAYESELIRSRQPLLNLRP